MKYILFLYEYQVQNTLPPQRVYDTSAAPSTNRKRRAAARQQEYSRLRSRKKKKSAFSAALDARRRCEIRQWREV